jgi:hypothetical protein
MLERKDHVQLVIGGISCPTSRLNSRARHLTNCEQVPRVQTDLSVHFREELVELRTIRSEEEA